MGSVYTAKRSDGLYNKEVAIKILSRGMDTPANIARFRREQQILATLDHPHIAQLLDGGVTDNGLPYLVMEYVDGTPLHDYCNRHQLPLAERLELFKSVCRAVQHAHQNTVIHRDLKPSNILVTNDGTIKVLDFGIAKLLEPEDPEATIFKTRAGSRLFTLAFAAPEQIEGGPVTTATDSYGLGVLLYELLAGIHPFELEDKNLTEIEKLIREQAPDRPTSKFENLPADKQNKIAEQRNTTASKLINYLHGDLEAIIMKALRKEPEARYSSAEQLLEDLTRREQSLPVIAREDTFRYNASKFIRRHKTGISVAAGFLLLIVGFASFYTWQIAEERNKAQMEAEKAEEVTAFLLDLFESSDPYKSGRENLTAKELLDRGLERSESMADPIIQTEMLKVIGAAYSNLGFQLKGENILDSVIYKHEKLYGKQSLEMADLLVKRGNAEGLNYDIAHPYYIRAYEIYNNHNNSSPLSIGTAAERLSYTYRYKGKIDSAEFFARKALQIKEQELTDENHTQVLEAKSTLAYVLRKKGALEEAKNLYLDIISKRETESFGRPLELGELYNNLAFVYHDQENYKEAAKYLRKSLKINENKLGPGHTQTLQVRSNWSSPKSCVKI
jgi:serine/threonine-protein kinase